jgi:hypothetical protein
MSECYTALQCVIYDVKEKQLTAVVKSSVTLKCSYSIALPALIENIRRRLVYWIGDVLINRCMFV